MFCGERKKQVSSSPWFGAQGLLENAQGAFSAEKFEQH